jgi:hypothetical protein
VRAWKKDVARLKKETDKLKKRYNLDSTTVSAADWDNAVRGKFGKLRALYGKEYPKEDWPEGVPYLNLIARAEWFKKTG